jgi:hypothetical protein
MIFLFKKRDKPIMQQPLLIQNSLNKYSGKVGAEPLRSENLVASA